jgi:hypothetical protein
MSVRVPGSAARETAYTGRARQFEKIEEICKSRSGKFLSRMNRM